MASVLGLWFRSVHVAGLSPCFRSMFRSMFKVSVLELHSSCFMAESEPLETIRGFRGSISSQGSAHVYFFCGVRGEGGHKILRHYHSYDASKYAGK